MSPTLRRILQVICLVAFAITAYVAADHHAMPWPALLGCFALMGGLMFVSWLLWTTPRPTKQCLAIWLIPVGLIADLQSMWHALADHPQPSLPVASIALAFVLLGAGLSISAFISSRRSAA